MRKEMIVAIGACLLAAASVSAQSPPVPDLPPLPSTAAPQLPPPTSPPLPEGPDPLGAPPILSPAPSVFKYWAQVDYLAYWVKNAPMPVSILTGDPNNPTQELLNTSQSFGMFSGVRLGLGVWLDVENTLGLEANGFSLMQRTRTFAASSDGNGNPTLAFPFINQTPGAVGFAQMPITSPGAFAGGVSVASSLQLWGAEANGLWVVVPNTSGFQLTALAGVRYLELRENLSIDTVSSDILTSPSTVLSQSDQFNTRNQFYGGQLGARISWQTDRFAVGLTGKLALGDTHQTVDIQGVSTQSGPGGINGTFPGGFFAQPSNSGHFSANSFSVIPALELKVSYFITPQVRLFAGYDFLYWSQVVRPGNQIDHNINLSQSAVFGNGVLSGPAYPMQSFSRSDFWAQGINLGLEFRF